jgi:hypothetical protein
MAEDPQMLRRRIALYRESMPSGLDSEPAGTYLGEIIRAERALSELESKANDAPAPR